MRSPVVRLPTPELLCLSPQSVGHLLWSFTPNGDTCPQAETTPRPSTTDHQHGPGLPKIVRPNGLISTAPRWDHRSVTTEDSAPSSRWPTIEPLVWKSPKNPPEAVLKEFDAHADLVAQAVAGHDAILDWEAPNRSKIATIAHCAWPCIGYGSEPAEADERLIAFGQGVAAAVEAATPERLPKSRLERPARSGS